MNDFKEMSNEFLHTAILYSFIHLHLGQGHTGAKAYTWNTGHKAGVQFKWDANALYQSFTKVYCNQTIHGSWAEVSEAALTGFKMLM